MRAVFLLAPVAALMLGGCLAKAAVGAATAPFKIAGKAVDLATTSQSEADESRGREIRRREERLGELEREYTRHYRRCQEGNRDSCAKAETAYAEIQRILPTVPVEP